MRRFILLAVILLAVALSAVYFVASKTNLGLMIAGRAVPSSTIVSNLSSDDPDLVMTSLNILQERNSSDGQKQARALLTSANDYIWFNAALYLAAIKDQQSVPYLIKGLKHPASRAYPEVAADLLALTGKPFAMDQEKWIAWWKQTNPGSNFSFKYASLQRQADEIQNGNGLLINGVIDPLTLSYSGTPILVVGVRLKKGASATQALRLLETAVVAQYIEVQRDGPTGPDGSVPAMLYWTPNPSPAALSSMRQGLPAVPFTKRTSIQGYLLQSGLYELDLSAVKDSGYRDELTAAAPTTQPK
ncbi:MAG TPA: hypothetical protein VFE47_28245 [Tepidisphaeraceae bacterium]|jgi:hypothetical protein|nr:hypothetical protein [Tepidisphaeraceae bacterium]